MDNTGIIIQARMSSSRLNGKILMELPAGSGISMLGRVIVRAKNALDKVIVATSDRPEDDATEQEAREFGAKVFRGDLEDVLSRYIKAAEEYKIDRIVRITADCPFVDYNIIKACINLHEKYEVDYVSNVENRTFPHGLDVEVISLDALKRIDKLEKDIKVREHVTWHARESDEFSKVDLVEKSGKNYSDIRVTVDTYEDYALANLLCFMLKGDHYQEIIDLFETYPWLKMLNNNVYQKNVFRDKKEEVKEAIKLLELHGMNRAKEILEKGAK